MKTISKLEQTYAPIILDGALVRQTTEQVGYVSHRSGDRTLYERKVSIFAPQTTHSQDLQVMGEPKTLEMSPEKSRMIALESSSPDTQTQCEHYSACPQRRCNGSGFWYETKGDSKIKVECRSYE